MSLLNNPSFEGGHYQWNDVPEMAIPRRWDFWFAKDDIAKLPRQDDPWFPPEMVVWNRDHAPLDERDLFFRDGQFIVKGFGGWKPIWFSLFQDVSGLTVGQRYLFTVPIYPDLVVDYDVNDNKVFAPDPLSGEVRLAASSTGTEWLNGTDIEFGEYNILTLEFVADATTMQLSIECRGRWGLQNNGWFIDALELEAIGEPEPPDDDGDLDIGEILGQVEMIKIELTNTLSRVENILESAKENKND